MHVEEQVRKEKIVKQDIADLATKKEKMIFDIHKLKLQHHDSTKLR